MNKTEFIDRIAEKADLPRADATKAVEAFTDSIAEALRQGDTVTLVGFGTFKVSERAARTGRNPRTGEAMEIPASKVPSFKAGKGLKDQIKR